MKQGGIVDQVVSPTLDILVTAIQIRREDHKAVGGLPEAHKIGDGVSPQHQQLVVDRPEEALLAEVIDTGGSDGVNALQMPITVEVAVVAALNAARRQRSGDQGRHDEGYNGKRVRAPAV